MTLHDCVKGPPVEPPHPNLSDIFTAYDFARDPYPEGRGIFPRTGWSPQPYPNQDVWRSQRLVSAEMLANLDAEDAMALLGIIEDQALDEYRRRSGDRTGAVSVYTAVHMDYVNPLTDHRIYTTTIRPR